MASDDTALEAMASGPDGLLAGLAPGKVHIEMSTFSPHASVELAGRVRAAGAEMLDAPVSGSVPQAETGTLTIMVGGEDDGCERAEAAYALRAQLPSAREADRILEAAERLGYAHRDIAAVHEVLALHSDGLRVPVRAA